MGARQGRCDRPPNSGEHFLDLLLYPYGDDDYDNVNEYDVMVRAPKGVSLLRAEKPDNWVFSDPGALFTVVDGAANHLFINAVSPDERVDIAGFGRNAARIYYGIDPGIAPGLYPITLEQATTQTYSAIPGDRMPPLDVTDPGLVRVTPEPSGLLALLGASAMVGLRRRWLESWRRGRT